MTHNFYNFSFFINKLISKFFGFIVPFLYNSSKVERLTLICSKYKKNKAGRIHCLPMVGISCIIIVIA